MLLSLFNSAAVRQKVSPPGPAPAELPVAILKDNGGTEGYRPDISLVLAEHRKWLASRGEAGTCAQLSGCSLRNLDLHGADLRSAFLRKVDLSGADLSLADLRGACLVQASLQKANLLDARLQGAALQGALLDGVTRLLPEQLAGANLSGASLPRQFDDSLLAQVKAAQAACQGARRFLTLMLLACLGGTLLVWKITDVQLLMNSPIFTIPFLTRALPSNAFLLMGPLVLLGLFVRFHLQLLRLWERLAGLPAMFPDGQPLDRKDAWLLTGLARAQFQWPGDERLPPSLLELALLVLFAYWVVPFVLLLFWGRYLTRLDLQGTIYQAGVLVAAVFLAAFLPRRISIASHGWNSTPDPPVTSAARTSASLRAGGVAAVAILLCLLSFGTIHGLPHDGVPGDPDEIGVRTWAPKMLWLAGYDPYASLPEAQISVRPPGWSGRDEDVQLVRGPRLDEVSLRHAAAAGVFLANARLGEADLRDADLTEADLRAADLHKANLQSAVLDRARLSRANLQGATLPGASLLAADLRAANLSYASLAEAKLGGAVLEGSIIFAATLKGAALFGANLESADLRDSNLENADLNQANLRGAHLWFTKLAGARLREVQLQNALLIEADLRRAILRGANLQGAVLRDALLNEADVQGADLRGVVGLTVAQICSAFGRRDALLDEPLRLQMAQQCP